MIFRYIIFLLSFFIAQKLCSENTTYILIHGTWATHASWYKPGGNFYDTLYSIMDDTDAIVSFSWSGGVSEKARADAAIFLLDLLEYIDTKHCVLVAHSHGGNVALAAVRELQHCSKRRINALILLGTPHYEVFEESNNVDFIFNFFSFGDMVQPVFNLFRREIPQSPRSANIAVTIEGIEPNHARLYHSLIAFYVPFFSTCSNELRLMLSESPHIAAFSYKKPIEFFKDNNRESRIKLDKEFQDQLPLYILYGQSDTLFFDT